MLISAHVNRLRLANYRPSTLRARESTLKAFEAFVAPTDLRDVTRFQVEAFLSRDLAPESRRAYRGHVRGFYQWALDEQLVTADPTAKLPPVRIPKASPRPIRDADLLLAVEQATPRMRAWLLLMALGGLRCIEVAALRPRDLTVDGDQAMLFLSECKGGGSAHVPANGVIVQALRRLPIREEAWWTCTPRHVSLTVGVYLHGLGIDASAHQLRHWAGTAWYRQSGHDLLVTAALLRHQNVATTQIYAQTDPTRPAAVAGAVELLGQLDPAAALAREERAAEVQVARRSGPLRPVHDWAGPMTA